MHDFAHLAEMREARIDGASETGIAGDNLGGDAGRGEGGVGGKAFGCERFQDAVAGVFGGEAFFALGGEGVGIKCGDFGEKRACGFDPH